MKKATLFLIFHFLFTNISFSQTKKSNYKANLPKFIKNPDILSFEPEILPPNAFLVELFTQSDRIKKYRESKDIRRVKWLENEVPIIIQKTTEAFKIFFDYCPVYFFMDTVAEEISKGHFAHHLLDYDLKVVDQPIIAEGDKTVFIGHYGRTYMQDNEKYKHTYRFNDAPFENNGGIVNLKNVLVIEDCHFNQLYSNILRNSAQAFKDFTFIKKNNYNYVSKHFDLEFKSSVVYKYNNILKHYKFKKRNNLMAVNKTQKTEQSVSAYIATIPNIESQKDCESLINIMKKTSNAEPKMWGTSIIGFGDYHYKYASGREGDWFLCGFSPRKSAISLYLLGCYLDTEKFNPLFEKLGKYKKSKGCIYIKKLANVNVGILEQIIKESNQYLINNNPFADK